MQQESEIARTTKSMVWANDGQTHTYTKLDYVYAQICQKILYEKNEKKKKFVKKQKFIFEFNFHTKSVLTLWIDKDTLALLFKYREKKKCARHNEKGKKGNNNRPCTQHNFKCSFSCWVFVECQYHRKNPYT